MCKIAVSERKAIISLAVQLTKVMYSFVLGILGVFPREVAVSMVIMGVVLSEDTLGMDMLGVIPI